MKILKLIIIGFVLLLTNSIEAQVSVNVSIGTQPQWGPAGYGVVKYYYIPDVEAYYEVETATFIYFGDGVWLHRTYLPSRYSNYDLYYGYKVVMTDYHGNTPYIHFKQHKVKYHKGYRGKAQKTIGQKPGNKVGVKSSNHPNKQIQQKNSGAQQKQKGHGGGHGKKK